MQAGQSGRGREFAASWGELVFSIYPTIAVGKSLYRGFKEALAAKGRDPAQVKVAPCVQVVAGATKAMAEDRKALIDSLAKPEDALVLLSEILNYDFAARPVDAPFTDDELKSINRAYEERFGRIYIVCATGKSADEMLAIAKERMTNDPAAEVLRAAEEQRKITELRLERMVLG